MKFSARDIAHLRFLKSGLIKPFGSVGECLEKLMGVQAQVQMFAEISLYNRLENADRDALKRLYEKHDIIKVWAQRMTVHIFAKNDWPHISNVYAGRKNFVRSMCRNKDRCLDAALSKLENFLKEKPRTKGEISEFTGEMNLDGIGEEFRSYCLILQATMEGRIFGIPEHPHTRRFKHKNFCMPESESESKDDSLRRMMAGYFKNYGPASLSDFLHWSGLRKSEAIGVFNELDLDAFEFNGNTIYLLKKDKDAKHIGGDYKSVKMLGKFDPLFVCYADKSWMVSREDQKLIWRAAGHVEAVLAVNEEFGGTWRYAVKGGMIDFNFFLKKSLSNQNRTKAVDEARRIAKFLGKTPGNFNFS